jgi:hypothetical protein
MEKDKTATNQLNNKIKTMANNNITKQALEFVTKMDISQLP